MLLSKFKSKKLLLLFLRTFFKCMLLKIFSNASSLKKEKPPEILLNENLKKKAHKKTRKDLTEENEDDAVRPLR